MAASSHYDYLASRKGSIYEREESPLSRQFSFNNWIKAVLLKLATPHAYADGISFLY